MKAVLFGIVVAILGYVTANSLSEAAIDNMAFKEPVVVELFTSQSCSSCPAADELVQSLTEDGKNENLIVLACHVSYWNHLHWEDDLSHEFCTQRQRNYQINIQKRQVFTPQLLVNGKYSAIGSQPLAVNSVLMDAKYNPIKGVKITLNKESGTLSVTLPKGLKDKKNLYLSAVLYDTTKKTRQIRRGENGGRSLTYKDNVTNLQNRKLEENASEFTVQDIRESQSNSLAILIHDGNGGEILAAGKI